VKSWQNLHADNIAKHLKTALKRQPIRQDTMQLDGVGGRDYCVKLLPFLG
jgi:hypothetical protein